MSALRAAGGDFVSKAILDVLIQECWKYIHDHPDVPILRINWKIFGIPIRKTFTTSDLASAWEWLLGPPPEPVS